MIIMNTTKDSTSKMGNFPQYTLKQNVWGEKDLNYLVIESTQTIAYVNF